MGEGLAAPDKQGNAGTHASTPMDDDGSQEVDEEGTKKNDKKQSKGLADLMQKGMRQPPHVGGQSCLALHMSGLQE